jgi:hypothetical protein
MPTSYMPLIQPSVLRLKHIAPIGRTLYEPLMPITKTNILLGLTIIVCQVFFFGNHNCNIKIWTCYHVQISGHTLEKLGDVNVLYKINKCCVTIWTYGHRSYKISFCYTIVSNRCKVIKIVYKVVIDHAMITSRMVLLGNEHKVCVWLLHRLTCIGQHK